MLDQISSESPKQVRHWVEERLRDAILSGQFEPGTWLRQQRLAEELGVSQMPIREALKELAAQGLVEHIPYRGMRVVGFSADDVADLYAHRCFLEVRAARAAAENIIPETLTELQTLQALMEEHLAPQDLKVYRELNRRFHEVIIAASGHPYLIRTLGQMWETFPTMLWSKFPVLATQSLPQRDADDLHEHRAILVALENRDVVQAENLVRRHIEAAGNQLVAFLRESEQLSV
jgi:DNA-binding GntR family transcriptional regulator